MRKKLVFVLVLLMVSSFRFSPSAGAVESAYSGNFIVPENQSGFLEEGYEVQVGRKLERGLKNFFLSPLEIPHGVKGEYYYRRQEYLEPGIESFFLGAFKGGLNMFKRAGVGFYEIFTCPYAQGPVIEEMEEWLY